MADPTGWITPVTNWATTDGILNTDLNRIEKNIELLKGRIWAEDGTFSARVNTPYFSSAVTVTITYSVINKTVFLDIPVGFETPLYTANTELQIEPVTTWPANIIPATATRAKAVFKNNGYDGTHFEKPGYMLIPNSTSSNIVCYITEYGPLGSGDGYYVDNAFHLTGGGSLKKGMPRQTVTYMIETAPDAATTTTSAP